MPIYVLKDLKGGSWLGYRLGYFGTILLLVAQIYTVVKRLPFKRAAHWRPLLQLSSGVYSRRTTLLVQILESVQVYRSADRAACRPGGLLWAGNVDVGGLRVKRSNR
jgi:hypothetical protein